MPFAIFARLLPFLLVFLFGVRAMAADIVVVQDAPLKIFEQFRVPFLDAISTAPGTTGPKQILPYECEVVNLSDFANDNAAHAAISWFSPRLVVSLGQKAFDYAVSSETVPLVYALVVSPEKTTTARTDITGISLEVSPTRQLDLFSSAFSFKKLGVVYSIGSNSAVFLQEARKAAASRGIEIVSASIGHVKEAPGVIKSLAGRIDALWLIPDTMVLTSSTLEYLAYFSLKNKIPIFGFSEKLLQFGAAAGISINIPALGAQTAGMVLRILAGTPAANIPVEEPARIKLQINRRIIDTLGITLKKSFSQSSSEVNP